MVEGTFFKELLEFGVFFNNTGVRTIWIELSKKQSLFVGGAFALYIQSSISPPFFLPSLGLL